MRRILITGLLGLGLCLCAITPQARADDAVPTYVSITKPAAGTPILVVVPEVELGLLTASGATDPKEDWSQSAKKFLGDSAGAALTAKTYKTASADLTNADDPRAVQILKLNDAVTASIMMNASPVYKLPTKTSFDWTLGDGATTLAPASTDATAAPPAYALFIHAKGSYSSGGRAAMMVGMAVLGVGMPMGGQYIQSTLVDLKTGQIVWYQFMVVPAGTDIRTSEGAVSAMTKLFEKLPL